MFRNITWTNYIVVIIVLLAIYYLFIGIRFYFRDLQDFLTQRRKDNKHFLSDEIIDGILQSSHAEPFEESQSEQLIPDSSFAQTSDDTFEDIERLIVQLKEAICDAGTKTYTREEFFLLLRLILIEYPHLKDSPFQSALNELIVSECEKYGSIVISEEEVVMLWNEVG